jgi:hypothetical protein
MAAAVKELQPAGIDSIEQTLFTSKECFVYPAGPRKNAVSDFAVLHRA